MGDSSYVRSLVRDSLFNREFKKAHPVDGPRIVKRLRAGDTPTDDELAMIEEFIQDLIPNEGRLYLRYYGKGADYDENDPSDVDLYDIDVVGLGGIYVVVGDEMGDSEPFFSLDDAKSW